MFCRGIRGAITVPKNTKKDIIAASVELLQKIVATNRIDTRDVACIIFTATPDLNAAFPAAAARQLGWTNVPLLCAREIDVPGSLARCLRILVLFNTDKAIGEIEHVYLRGTEKLRED